MDLPATAGDTKPVVRRVCPGHGILALCVPVSATLEPSLRTVDGNGSERVSDSVGERVLGSGGGGAQRVFCQAGGSVLLDIYTATGDRGV